MGTLFDQAERDYKRVSSVDVDDFLAIALDLAKKHSIDVATVVAAKHALEIQRQNSIYVANGDAFDEQIAGLGEIAESIKDALLTIGDHIESLSDS